MSLVIMTLIFGIVETWYFGWNAQPETITERICDAIVIITVVYGLLSDFIKKRLEVLKHDILEDIVEGFVLEIEPSEQNKNQE
jgi:hypothetical protein